ncbi:hypothetical protein P885DRAFT_82426 [Corynascus similis CBS 632.67]
MATNEDVKLSSPADWETWNNCFKSEAATRDLWELIKPDGDLTGYFRKPPVRPALENYPKLLTPANAVPAQSTRSGETRVPAHMELVDEGNPPANLMEMTTAGREGYRADMSDYRFEIGLYENERKNVNQLSAWIRKTVASHIYDTTCDADDTLDKWYIALKERVGSHDNEELERAMVRYEAATKPLNRKPKDMAAWLTNWDTAFQKAKKANYPATTNSKLWWLQFERAVKNAGYESWCEAYYVNNRTAINSNTFTPRTLIRDFGERIRKDTDQPLRSIAKGAFPSYTDQEGDDDYKDDHKEQPARGSNRNEQRDGRKSPRSRNQSRAGSWRRDNSRQSGNRARSADRKRRYTGGSKSGCPACQRPHMLEECWFAFPDRRPSHLGSPPQKLADEVKERLAADTELQQLVNLLRKRTKLEDTQPQPTRKEVKWSEESN